MSNDLSGLLPEVDSKTALFVNYLFERLSGIIPTFQYSAKCNVSLESKKREYTYRIMDEGISDAKVLNRAIDKISKAGLKFLPSPAEFIEFCMPSIEDIGAPSLDDAYKEACKQAHPQSWEPNWSHKAVEHAYRITGSHAFLNYSPDKLYQKFSQNYRQAVHDFAAGRIMDQVEHQQPFSATDVLDRHWIGEYEFIKAGVMKAYQHVSSFEEFQAIAAKILKNDNSLLSAFMSNLEKKYQAQGLLD